MTVAKSARGLFRATGKTGGDKPRAADDFYPTPPEPTRALLHAEASALRRFPAIWEPAAGDGAMVREIEGAGHRVIASDLVDRGAGATVRDFFAYEAPPAPALVTNPPFFECNWRDGRGRWITHGMGALGLAYMALLLPWTWPGPAGLGGIWSRMPPARVYMMRWKIDFTGEGAPPTYHGWYVWDQAAPIAPPALLMLDRADARQAELFGEAAE